MHLPHPPAVLGGCLHMKRIPPEWQWNGNLFARSKSALSAANLRDDRLNAPDKLGPMTRMCLTPAEHWEICG